MEGVPSHLSSIVSPAHKLLYNVIHTDSNYVHLQQDIDNIFEWTFTNLMTFNPAKCKCLLKEELLFTNNDAKQ